MSSLEVAPQDTVTAGAKSTLPDMNSDAFQSPELERENEFAYHPIPVLAPISLVLGILGVIGLGSWTGMVVPILGFAVGMIGWRQIASSNGELGGKLINGIGLLLSTGFLLSGASLHAYTYATEVPEGYERLSFRWLAQQKPIMEDGALRIADEAKALDGQRIFVKGYMYPERAKENLKQFVLCKDTGQCCFGGNPALTDMIVVNFVNDTRATFRELSLVNVAGVFRAKKIVRDGEVIALYTLEGEYFK